jgi:hypothetical protein
VRALFTIPYILFFLPIFLLSCLSEVKLDINQQTPQLVVEGYISDKAESYQVRLSTSFEVNGLGTNTLGRNAHVEIRELEGASWQLNEVKQGIYEVPATQVIGAIGKSYQLYIRLSNGDEYESSVETILDPVNILSGEALYVEETFIGDDEIKRKNIQHDVFVELQNNSKDQFFKVENIGWAKVEIGYGNCEIVAGPIFCWQYRNPAISNILVTGTNSDINNNDYKIKAVSIPVDSKHKYVAIVQVKSMSEKSYTYWNQIKDQLNRPGGIFDRPFAPIIGNIESKSNNIPALGYFHTYSITEQIVCFERFDAQITFPLRRVFCSDLCTEIWSPGTFDDMGLLLCD